MPTRQSDKSAPRTSREEDELALCQARLAHTQRLTGVGCWEWEPEANTLWWSAEVFRIFGQEEGRSESSYAAFLSGIHPDDREAFGATLRGALEQRLPLNIEFRIVRPDGRLRFVHTQGELVSLGAGRPAVMFGTLQDVTERKASEQRIVQLAYHDTLTGPPNRWMFQDRLSQALAAAGRDGRQVGVMFLDLDHFKDVNDTLGHDFGTGYSSLRHLRQFPICRIKIDHSLVADLTSNPDGAALVEAIIAMGRSLGLKVMAEGVESREQLEFLMLRGCDEAQGFFFARPLPAAELTAVLNGEIRGGGLFTRLPMDHSTS